MAVSNTAVGGPVIVLEGETGSWFDTFNDTSGVYSTNNVLVDTTREDAYMYEGYMNDFDSEPLGAINGWTYEVLVNPMAHNIIDDPFESGRCLWLARNDNGGNYDEHILWKEFGEYYELVGLVLTPWEIRGNNNRQGYFYIEFYNAMSAVIHEVRYYWDDTRSGVPASTATLTAIDLNWPLNEGGPDMGDIRLYLNEDISADIEANPSADLTTILADSVVFRYGFYQDAGSGQPKIDQVHIDNLWIHSNNTGNMTSIEITCPAGYGWDEIQLGKTEPGTGNYIEITVVDGATLQVIGNLQNLGGSIIDITSIDVSEHPTIRLIATFTNNGSWTPVLHDWRVVFNKIPSTPTGLTVTNPLNGYSLILSWNPNPESDIAKYILYYSSDNITFYSLANASAYTFSFTHYGLDVGATYFYKIAAGDDANQKSPFSGVVEGAPDRDYDGDGIGDAPDPDDDNDGIPDVDDPQPKNPHNYIEDTVGNINTTVNDIEDTVSDINTTVNDIQDQVTDIQLDIATMNTTLGDLQTDIDYLNQTIPLKIDDLSLQLADVNDSLQSRVTEAEVTILDYLAGLNTTLSEDIQNMLWSITNDIIGLNASLSSELTNLLSTMTTEHDALQQWLDIVLSEIGSNLTATNETLHKQMNDLDASVTSFYLGLTDDIAGIEDDLQEHDEATGDNHSYIISLLDDLFAGQIEKEKIHELRTFLINLAGNLSEHNQTIADDIMDVVNDIDEFEVETDAQLERMNQTLGDLAKLEQILGDLHALDQSLEQAEEEIQDSIDDRSTKKEDEERFFMIELFLIILFILIIIDLILTVLMGKRRGAETPPVAPQPPVGGTYEQQPPQAQPLGEEEHTSPIESEAQEEPSSE